MMAFNRFPNIKINPDHFEEDVKVFIKQIRPTWDTNSLQIKKFHGGVSNLLFGVYSDEVFTDATDMVLIRIYGEMLLDRDVEMENMSALSKFGLAANVHGKFENGCSYQFIHGTMLNRDDLHDELYQRLIINEFVRLHTVTLDLNRNKEPFIFPKLRELANNLPDCLTDPDKNKIYLLNFPNKIKAFQEIECLEKHLVKPTHPITFCHNDLVVNNIILNLKKNRIHLIDFEYADYNYCAFDIGNHFNEFAGLENPDYSLFPSEIFQKKWIRQYLEGRLNASVMNGFTINGNSHGLDENEIEHWYKMVNKFSLASHLMWSMWSIWQYQKSVIDFDYLDYAIMRWNEYQKNKDKFLSL